MVKKQKNKERMAELRAKRKPPKLANVHPSVLELPDEYPGDYWVHQHLIPNNNFCGFS